MESLAVNGVVRNNGKKIPAVWQLTLGKASFLHNEAIPSFPAHTSKEGRNASPSESSGKSFQLLL